MINRDDLGSWLDGPPPAQDFPGQRMGRPESGPGSIARLGSRILALVVDWFIALGLAALLVSYDMQNLVTIWIWFGLTAVSVGFAGHTLGHYLLGLQVQTTDGYAPGLWRGFIRSALIVVVIPALIMDADQRGLHDRAVGTVLVKTR